MQSFRDIGDRWSVIKRLYNSYGNTLNSNDMKAMKGKTNEFFVEASLGNLEHVDKLGYDLVSRATGIKVEVKSCHNLLLTQVGRKLRKNITFRFKNSNGSNKMDINENNTADIYILLQQDAIAMTTREHVLPNIHGSGDLTAKVPSDSIELLYSSPQAVQLPENPIVNLPEIIKKIMKCVTVAIWNDIDIKTQLKNCLYDIADNL